MSKVGAFLKKKIGPLPAGAWLGIAVVALVAYRLFFSKQADAAGTAGQTADTTADTGTPDLSGYGSAGGNGSGDVSQGSTLDTGALLGAFTDLAASKNDTEGNLAGVVGELGLGGLDVGNSAVTTLGDVADTSIGSFADIATNLSDRLGEANASLVSAAVKGKSTVVVAPKSSAPTKYYTYKKDVKLGPGETLGFTPGKGYYAKPASGASTQPATKPATPPSSGTGSTTKKPPSPAVTAPKEVPNPSVRPQTHPIKYFTYKKDVKLGPGQTVHFTAGKGYYAA